MLNLSGENVADWIALYDDWDDANIAADDRGGH